MLKRLQAQDITIIVSTPYMDEAALCDRIALIQGGKILSIDTPQSIVQSYPEQLFAVKANEMYRLLKALESYPGILRSYAFGEYAHATFRDPDFKMGDLEAYLAEQGLTFVRIEAIEATIEDSFIKLLN